MAGLPLPFRFEVRSVPESASDVRHQLSEVLALWGLANENDDARADFLLLANEMVVNAIMHGGGGIVGIAIEQRPDLLKLDVYDGSEEPPQIIEHGDSAENGRGMVIVNSLAKSWGWEHTGRGKRVWAEIHIADVQRSGCD